MAGAFWSGVGEQGSTASWSLVAASAPFVALAVLAGLVAFALLRDRRYRVAGAFSDADQQTVHAALVKAERRTVGEVLPVVVERSDPHPAGDWLAALAFVLAASALAAVWLPSIHPALWLLLQAFAGVTGFALARALPAFKRLFVFEARATEVAEEQAIQEFYLNGLHRTAEATGVLLFVSLFEHRVIVMADEGIHSRVGTEAWAGVDRVVLDAIRRGSIAEGLVQGIGLCEELLARHFPWQHGDRNEIPDRLIVRAAR